MSQEGLHFAPGRSRLTCADRASSQRSCCNPGRRCHRAHTDWELGPRQRQTSGQVMTSVSLETKATWAWRLQPPRQAGRSILELVCQMGARSVSKGGCVRSPLEPGWPRGPSRLLALQTESPVGHTTPQSETGKTAALACRSRTCVLKERAPCHTSYNVACS